MPHKQPLFWFMSLSHFFFCILGFEFRAYVLNHSTSFFLWRVFWDRVSWTIYPGWLWIKILPISAPWVARIIGISHRHLSREWVLKKYIGWLGTLKISVHSCFLNCQRKYIWMCYLVSFVLERLYLYIYHIFIRKVFKTTNLTHKIGWQY
jgi:hypothetical protein